MEPSLKPRSFPWLFRWKFWRALLLIVAGLFTLIALFHAEENWRGKRAWENYQREMEAKGVSFDFAKYVPPPVPDDQNFAMTPFLAPIFDFIPGTQRPRDTNAWQRTQGAVMLPSEVIRTLEKDGWPKGERLDLIHLANELATTNRSAPPRFLAGQTQEAARAILENLKPTEPIFDELRIASQRPYSRFNIDYDWESKFSIVLPHVATIRMICHRLELRASAELALGQPAAAFQDVGLMFHLLNSIRSEPFLISQLVRAACLTQILQPMWEGLGHHQWSEKQLADFTEELRTLDFVDDDIRSIRAEQGFCDSFFVEVRSSRNPVREMNAVNGSQGDSEGAEIEANFGLLIPRGWFYLEELNYHRLFDDEANGVMTPKGIDPDVADRKDADVLRELASGGFASSILHHRAMSRIVLPALSSFESRMARAQTYANLASIACALERYRLVHGQFPETLDSLVPQFLAVVPRDVIMDQPLKYRRADDVQFILYSVGWNKTDDGGIPAAKESEERTHGDWVWTYPTASPRE
jgi:hypothetical protein